MRKDVWLVGFPSDMYKDKNPYGQSIIDMISLGETNVKLSWILEERGYNNSISALSAQEWKKITNIVLDRNSTHTWCMMLLNKSYMRQESQSKNDWISFPEFVNQVDYLEALKGEVLETIDKDKVICLFPDVQGSDPGKHLDRIDFFSGFCIVQTAEEAMEIISAS